MYKKAKKEMFKEWKMIKKKEKKEKKEKKKSKKEDDCSCDEGYEMSMDTAMHYMGNEMGGGLMMGMMDSMPLGVIAG
jgi:hypothetical protein